MDNVESLKFGRAVSLDGSHWAESRQTDVLHQSQALGGGVNSPAG